MVQVRLLGSLAIEVDGAPVEPPASRRAQLLLGWLVLHPGTHSRAQLAGRFWPDVLDASARASLRSALWSLRRSLGPSGELALQGSRDQIGLDGVATDLERFESLMAAGEAEAALGQCRGELLAGLDDDWVLAARDEHRERVAQALERLASEAAEPRAAVAWARRWAALDPLSEPAARALMHALAAAGERSAALAVYARLRERFRFELGMSPASETRSLYEALRQDGEQGTRNKEPRVRPLPLIGRASELGALLAHWRRASAGSGGVVFLSGEGGIGKTRLATELLDRARAEGARVATCAAMDLGGTAPFGLWAELLRELTRDLPPVPADAAWAADIAPLAPDLGRAPAPSATPELERARLFEGAVELFEHASGDRPLLVLIEDLHVADPASVELAAYVGRRTPAMHALVVITLRTAARSADADALAGALARRGALLDDIPLSPLPHAALVELVRSVAELSDADVEHVARAAEGNALLAVESARAAAAGERGPPASLRAGVRAQVGALDPEAQLLAELVAVAGRELDRRETGALPVDHLTDAATAATDSGLLVVSDGRIGFRHALLRDAVYEDLPDLRRGALHETLATALAATVRSDAGHLDAEVARHLLLAGREEQAVAHLARAATHARGVAALPEAAAFLREAVAIAPDDPDLWMELAEVEAYSNRIDVAETCFERADDLLGRGPAPLHAAAWLRRARWFRGALCHPMTALASYHRVLGLLDAAALPAERQRAEALAGCAWCEACGGDAEIVDDLLGQVTELIAGADADDLLVHDIGAAQAFAFIRRGEFRASYTPGIEAGNAAMRAGRPDMAYGAWGNAASAAAAVGEFDRALQLAERSLAAAHSGGVLPLECEVQAVRSYVLARLRRFDDARAAVDAERELADRLDRDDLRAGADHDEGLIALSVGDYEAAEALLGRALDEGARVSRPLTRIARAEALARLGRADDAEAELRSAALEPVGMGDFPDTLVPRLTRVQALVALARGDRELAERRFREAADGWRRRTSAAARGQAYLANLIDLGRPTVVGLIEPVSELERIEAELQSLHASVA